MKRLRKLCDNKGVELSEDIIMEILHLLPSKSLARFKCVSKCWQKYIAGCRSQRWRPQPDFIGIFYQTDKHSQIGFFFESKESNNNHMHDLDESVNFLNRKVYIVASSNGFLLCTKDRKKPRDYYVYNPATRQYSSLPKTLFCMEGDLAIGFICKVDDPNKDVISFTIVRYEIPHHWGELPFTVTIESFFSETNVWTSNSIILDAPLRQYPLNWDARSSDGVIDGVFCWLDQVERQITVYDSVYKSFWALEFPEEIETTYNSYLGLSGGDFYFALNYGEEITVWKLESNIRSRVAVWVVKYDADVAATVLQCPEAFGLGGDTLRVEAFGITGSICIEVLNMVIHPVFPHIFYLDIRGKVISYDLETDTAEFVYDFKEPWWKTVHYKLFPYEWHQWPRLLSTVN
ncbi:F-box protein At5g49610-like [Lycium ferocissimum]|uniref:F-box protein At5g49610-like n=1 Tax=Lycium ferocissimum TaxID=112874 RepID=UPI0028165965|nr:F-box protein At5g49610-like [Lycium ferocissimum]